MQITLFSSCIAVDCDGESYTILIQRHGVETLSDFEWTVDIYHHIGDGMDHIAQSKTSCNPLPLTDDAIETVLIKAINVNDHETVSQLSDPVSEARSIRIAD